MTSTNQNTLFIPISGDGSTTSLNGLIALFVHSWSGGSGAKLALVNQSVSDGSAFSIKTIPSVMVEADPLVVDALTTTLPNLVLGRDDTLSELTVSGLAAVCRHIIRLSDNPEVRKVLGFRGNCLQAPAEVSVWTAFCEVLMPKSAWHFLAHSSVDGVLELPVALVQLEEHLKQPIRMHNVVKRFQQEHATGGQLDAKEVQKCAASLLDHSYAEGRDMTLADLLLYPCVRLVANRLTVQGVDLVQHLPRVARWLNSTMRPLVESAWADIHPDSILPDLSGLRIRPAPAIKVPWVEAVSLYKKDSNRPGVGALNADETAQVVQQMQSRRLWPDGQTIELPAGLVSYLDVSPCNDFVPVLDWSSLPAPVHPQQGHVPGKLSENLFVIQVMRGVTKWIAWRNAPRKASEMRYQKKCFD